MNEDFLHYLWKFQLFTTPQLKTTDGEPVTVIKPGVHNFNAGPDFLQASVKLGDREWFGNVEIHLNASDWWAHKHHEDENYENVILHVVLNNDRPVHLKKKGDLPTLVVSGYIYMDAYHRYKQFLKNRTWVPCASHIHQVEPFYITAWIDRLIVERLERKSDYIFDKLDANKFDWSETLYQILARNFGFKVNAHAFERLAESLPLKILGKHKASQFQIEALLFGQSGLLPDDAENYYENDLVNEYNFLKGKFDLKPIASANWKLLRLMPSNFPYVRIAQFAHLIYKSSNLFSKFIEIEDPREVHQLLDVQASQFWDRHYTFSKESKKRVKKLGRSSIENIIINTIVPFLFVYGRYKKEEEFVDRAFKLLQSCSAENNQILRNWKKLGIEADNAYESQGLIELKNEYCTHKKCLNCHIGVQLLKANRHDKQDI